jgi:hypothetical protein
MVRAAPEAGVPIRRLTPRDGRCRFIVRDGGPAETRYCGAPTSGGSWCADHRRIVFTPADAHAMEVREGRHG